MIIRSTLLSLVMIGESLVISCFSRLSLQADRNTLPCETFQQAQKAVAANTNDEADSRYHHDTVNQLDTLLHPVFSQYSPQDRDPDEFILRVSTLGVVECVIVPRQSAFSKSVETVLLGTRLRQPPRGPLYIDFRVYTFRTSVPEDPTGDPTSNYALKLSARASRPLLFEGVQFLPGESGKGRAARPAA